MLPLLMLTSHKENSSTMQINCYMSVGGVSVRLLFSEFVIVVFTAMHTSCLGVQRNCCYFLEDFSSTLESHSDQSVQAKDIN